MSAAKQNPMTVIAARNRLVIQIGEVGGERTTAPMRESIADWLISSGFLSETYYAAVEAETGEPE